MTNSDWIINIENLSENVRKKYGVEEVVHVLKKYGAEEIQDLDPNDYSDVYSELFQRDAD